VKLISASLLLGILYISDTGIGLPPALSNRKITVSQSPNEFVIKYVNDISTYINDYSE
jgi:hypothetical protein